MIMKNVDLYRLKKDLEGIVRKIAPCVQENPKKINVQVCIRMMGVRRQ